MSYVLVTSESKVTRLREEAWRVMGIPQRTISNSELATLLHVSPGTISQANTGVIGAKFLAGVRWVFRDYPDLVSSTWEAVPRLEAAS